MAGGGLGDPQRHEGKIMTIAAQYASVTLYGNVRSTGASAVVLGDTFGPDMGRTKVILEWNGNLQVRVQQMSGCP